MSIQTAGRMRNVRRSFVREMLKAAARPEVISFAGGLPNPKFIPVKEIGEAIQQTLAEIGPAALQYCASEGHPLLRQWIADQYVAAGLAVSVEQIVVTTGSQQGFDLLAKVLLEPGDRVVVEDPTYIAAIQSLGLYEPQWSPVPLDEEGIRMDGLRAALAENANLLLCIPNFQNPTGISYSASRRKEVAALVRDSSAVLIEDDPYGLLRFEGPSLPPIARGAPQRSVLFGSFSKVIAPGLRLGWLCAPMELMDRIIIAKQALDLCSENLGQWVMHRLVSGRFLERHLPAVRNAYGRQCAAMIEAVGRYLPDVRCTRPEGGMFLWLTLPEGLSSMRLFELAIEKGVAFVPGQAFYTCGGGERTLRLNFSNCEEDRIDEGIRRMAAALDRMRGGHVPR